MTNTNSRGIKCPQCSHTGTIVEVTQCEQAVPLKGVYKDEGEYIYTVKSSKRLLYAIEDAEVFFECAHCGKRWSTIDALMAEVHP